MHHEGEHFVTRWEDEVKGEATKNYSKDRAVDDEDEDFYGPNKNLTKRDML